MADFVIRAVERLREDPGFSRNRHYLALSSPEGRRALRTHRHLRSIERDLAAGASASVAAEAERVRRAKVIHAEGEMQASEKLLEAARVLANQPQALQLRYLQTLADIAGEKNSTIVFPLPMDLVEPLMKKLKS